MAATKDSFARALEALVRKFDADKESYLSPRYGEAQARIDFINPFFRALGWDIENEKGLPYHLRDVWVETGETEGRPDYSFRAGGQTKFYIEAKPPGEPLDNTRHILQAKSYAWSSKDVLFAGLTDFEEFRFFDASLRPDERHPLAGEAFHLQYTEYLEKLDLLWELSQERVAAGALDQFLKKDRKSIRYRKPVDESFLDELTQWRHDLAKSIHDQNPGLDARQLNEVVQRLLDRIVFVRIAEDRRVLDAYQLREIADLWEERGGKRPIMDDLVGLFQKINEDFNGEIFKPHPCEQVKVDSHVLFKIIRALYPPKSPYRFDAIDVALLGSIYERYLGNTLHVTPRQVRIELKPEVRKAGGVYYTPKFIVDYIVKHTVGKLVEGKTPKEVQNLRILDPACGSGSFLIGAYQYLMDWHLNYYREHPKEARVHPMYPEMVKDNGTERLSFHAKARILSHNLYGVDVDPQAVEITMMSLYLKTLEGERGMLHPKKTVLPELKYNIRCGNSLIGPDIEKETPLTPEERERIRPFDWHSREEGFGDILAKGGFDAVIGNPPWGAEFSDPEKRYLSDSFTLGAGKYESYIFFIERGTGLICNTGRFGFIVPSFWISRSQTEPLRAHLLSAVVPTSCIILPEDVFAGVRMDSCILTAAGKHVSQDGQIKVGEISKDELEVFAKGNHENIVSLVPVSAWAANPRFRFNPRVTDRDVALLEKIQRDSVRFDSIVEITQGLTLYRRATLVERFGKAKADEILKKRLFHSHRKKDKTFKKELLGKDVDRYYVRWNRESWVSYGPWLAHAVDERFFHGPRIVVQKIRNPSLRRRIVAGYLEDDETYSAGVLLNAIPRGGQYSLLYCLGILNSRLLNYWYRKMVLDVSIRVIDLSAVPIRRVDFASTPQRRIHDQIVQAVEQILKLAKAHGTDSRSFSKLDPEIDDLVYELYGITDEERKIIEDAAQAV